jgi:hypothetical protein
MIGIEGVNRIQRTRRSESAATMPADPIPRPWRRFLRFSVRGLIVLVLVVGAGLGWIVHPAHVQRDAVAAITMAGGLVQIRITLDASGANFPTTVTAERR